MNPNITRRDFLKLSGATALGIFLSTCANGATEEPMTDFTNDSPFGVYSPWGEFSLDRSKFATQDEISGYLRNIGIQWVQELPPFLAVDVVPTDIHLYSRVGREAGMMPPLIRNSDSVWNFQQELIRTITSGKDRFTYLEVDTEPDGLGGWQNDPEGYVELLKLCHEIIKGISPVIKIMFGGLSGGQEILDSQGTVFLEKAMAAGAAEYIDGLEFKRHHLGVKSYAQMKDHYRSICGILARYGKDIQKMPIFLETCMYDGDPNEPVPHLFIRNLPVQSETEQASGLVKTYVYAISLGIDKIFWNLVYERSDFEPGHATPFPQTPFNHYGLINNPTNADGLSHKKLAYYTYKKMIDVLDGSDWMNVQSVQESDDICAYHFDKQGKATYVIWWDYFNDPAYMPGDKKKVILSDLDGTTARVTEAVPEVQSGDLVSDYSTAFKEESVNIHKDKLTLTLGENPVYIEL